MRWLFSFFVMFQIVLRAAIDFSRLRKYTVFVSFAFTYCYAINFCSYISSNSFLQSLCSKFWIYFVVVSSFLSSCSFFSVLGEKLWKFYWKFISHLRNPHLAWKSVMPFFSKVSRVLLMWSFISSTNSEFMLKELLKFQSPLPLFSSLWKSSSRAAKQQRWVVCTKRCLGICFNNRFLL